MKILAFAASNSRQSINRQLVVHAAKRLAQQAGSVAQIEYLDLNAFEMPLYSIDREQADGVPVEAHRFLAAVSDADVILVSFAEHNGSYTAAYKNLFDWASRINSRVYAGKAMLLLATSPGPGGGQSVLKAATESMPYFGADVRGSFSIPAFYESFDSVSQTLVNPELSLALDEILQAFDVKAPIAA